MTIIHKKELKKFTSQNHRLIFDDLFSLITQLNDVIGSELESCIFWEINISFRLEQVLNHDVMDCLGIMSRTS